MTDVYSDLYSDIYGDDGIVDEDAPIVGTGSLITRPFQLETRGLLMGIATPYSLKDGIVEGLGSLGARQTLVPRPRQHGVRPVRQFSAERPLHWTLDVLGDSVQDALDKVAELGDAWAPLTDGTETDLAIRLGDDVWLFHGQPGRTAPDLTDLAAFTPSVDCEWIATDPRIYVANELDGLTFLSVTSGGLGFPMGFPHGFGSAGGRIATAHSGNVPVPWKAQIFGTAHNAFGGDSIGPGCTNPSLTLGSTGEKLEFIVHLSPGQWLELDSREQTVKLNGIADRSTAINRPTADQWFEIPPAADTIGFSGTGAGLLLVQYHAGSIF